MEKYLACERELYALKNVLYMDRIAAACTVYAGEHMEHLDEGGEEEHEGVVEGGDGDGDGEEEEVEGEDGSGGEGGGEDGSGSGNGDGSGNGSGSGKILLVGVGVRVEVSDCEHNGALKVVV
jgi:hypothetical protein